MVHEKIRCMIMLTINVNPLRAWRLGENQFLNLQI